MNISLTLASLAAIGFMGAALAQEPADQPNPTPATSETEGTAADRTQPGKTPTQGATTDPTRDAAGNPRPSTSQTEGTAADRTAPGQTPTVSGRTAERPAGTGADDDARNLVGASVVTRTNAPLGQVTDVVFDAKQQPTFVIISTEDQSTAVPYAAASSMMSGDKVVIDQAKLQSAPKVKEGEWRNQSTGKWQADATKYWNQG